MLRFFGHTLERLWIVLCAILLMQMPLFITQYIHELNGHVSELKWHVEQMTQHAAPRPLATYIQKFLEHSDKDFSKQGALMQTTHQRYLAFSNILHSLLDANALTRPFIFLASLQWEIAHSTWEHFAPGLSFTLESLMFALVGVVLGSVLLALLKVAAR